MVASVRTTTGRIVFHVKQGKSVERRRSSHRTCIIMGGVARALARAVGSRARR